MRSAPPRATVPTASLPSLARLVSPRLPSRPPPGTWHADSVGSTIGLDLGAGRPARLVGRFERHEARLEVGVGGHTSLVGRVDAASLVVAGHEPADRLLAADVLGCCAEHPELRFASTAVAIDGERLELDGELTIRGRTRLVTGAGVVAVLGGRIALTVATAFDARQFGLTGGARSSDGLAPARLVEVVVDLVLTPFEPTSPHPTL